MNLSPKHSILAGRLLVVLFVLANSGFTAVIRQCTMISDQPMDCCSNASDKENVPQTGATLAGVFPECHISTIVGGLTNTVAFFEKENVSHSSKFITLFPLLQELRFSNTLTAELLYSSNLSPSFFPRSAEKCILNSTFLI
ncbi:MAG: hypothetical protein WBZ48_01040 [Bacteroidota bacterium]